MKCKIIIEKHVVGHKKTSHNGKLYDVFLLVKYPLKHEASHMFPSGIFFRVEKNVGEGSEGFDARDPATIKRALCVTNL